MTQARSRRDHDPERQRAARGSAVVATASPLATEAAIEVLEAGGSAADALVAAQAVLCLVEPQASGFGGGSVIVWHHQPSGQAGVIDGLSAAPAAVTNRLEEDYDGSTLPLERVLSGGRTVGVPGTLRALEAAHARFGRLPWSRLFDSGRRLATAGFPLPPYLARTVNEIAGIRKEKLARTLYCADDSRALPPGTLVRNPDLGETLAEIAEQGADAFYLGRVASAITRTVQNDDFPGRINLRDFAAYRAVMREPVVGRFAGARLLTAPAPVFGGISALQIAGIAERLGLTGTEPRESAALLHAVLEAGRIAFADRAAYIGDPDYAAPPDRALLDSTYLESRAREIDPRRIQASVSAGDVGAPMGANGTGLATAMTSHLSIVDGAGLTIAMTTTINLNFGSRLSVAGFYLNNVQTNFARYPEAEGRVRSYNAMAPGKRPMTSFAPMLMIGADGRPLAALGAGGGNRIPGYVSNALLRIAAGQSDAQRIVAEPQALHAGGVASLEPDLEHHREGLLERGHQVQVRRLDGGTQLVLRDGNAWSGGGDVRRDGSAMAITGSTGR